MGQNSSTHHEPLDRARSARRSLRHVKGEKGASPRRMDRLRRSFRDSFRRRKEHVPESSKPHQWQADESAVRAGTCNFHVKYLGCVEVFESRGMQVCEEALKVLRNSRRRPVKAILYVSGDGLRVVEDETKGLIVDQTIEKVSFCAPDRNHEKGFSYICRDGTTKRWMCHGFLALKESGERLSHAVGCAFAACLERKQKRDKECGVTMTFDPKNSTFTRSGSFRQTSITERLQDPQELKHVEPPPVKPVFNPFAIERPHATASMLQRQGSFRGFQQLNQASPFKRQMSLRISDLPSTLERQRSLSLEGSDFRLPPVHMKAPVSPIPESSPLSDKVGDSVSAMCQQLSQGLSLLSSNDDFLTETPKQPTTSSSGMSNSVNEIAKQLFSSPARSTATPATSTSNSISSVISLMDSNKLQNNNNNNSIVSVSTQQQWTSTVAVSATNTTIINPSPVPVLNNRINWSPVLPPRSTPTPPPAPATSFVATPAPVTPIIANTELPRPEQWLGKVVTSTKAGNTNLGVNDSITALPPSPAPSPRRAPPLSQHLRAHSLGSAETFLMQRPASQMNGLEQQQQQQQQTMWASAHNANGQVVTAHDPFDAEWAAIASRNHQQTSSTNPFITPSTVKTFEVHM